MMPPALLLMVPALTRPGKLVKMPELSLIMPELLMILPSLRRMKPLLITKTMPFSTVRESPLFSVRDMFVTVHVFVLGSQLGLPDGRDWHDTWSLMSKLAA